MTSIKQRDKLYKKYVKANDNAIKLDYHLKYKNKTNIIVQLIRSSKQNHYKDYFLKNAKNIRNTWKGIKSIININSKSNKCGPTSLLIKNNVVTEPAKVADQFNQYFATIANKLQEKIHNSG